MNGQSSQLHNELMELEEVQEVIGKHDMETFASQEQVALRVVDEGRSFPRDVGAKVARVRQAQAKVAGKLPKRRVKQQGKSRYKLPGEKLPAVTTLSQADAKLWGPEGCTIWLGKYQGGTWQCQYRGQKRISRSLNKWGGE